LQTSLRRAIAEADNDVMVVRRQRLRDELFRLMKMDLERIQRKDAAEAL
jgi:hypothetical protein